MFVRSDRPAVTVHEIVRPDRSAKREQHQSGNQGDEYFIHCLTSLDLPFDTSLTQSTEQGLNSPLPGDA
jgi:hypothetical protein